MRGAGMLVHGCRDGARAMQSCLQIEVTNLVLYHCLLVYETDLLIVVQGRGVAGQVARPWLVLLLLLELRTSNAGTWQIRTIRE